MFTLSPPSTRAWLPPTTRRCTKIFWILRRHFYPPNQRASLSTSSLPSPLSLVSSSRHHHADGLQLNSSSHLGHWHHCGVANVPEVSEFVLFTPFGLGCTVDKAPRLIIRIDIWTSLSDIETNAATPPGVIQKSSAHSNRPRTNWITFWNQISSPAYVQIRHVHHFSLGSIRSPSKHQKS